MFAEPFRRSALSVLFLLVLSSPPSAAGAEQETGAGAPASPAVMEQAGVQGLLSSREALFLGNSLIAQGRLDEAAELYQQLTISIEPAVRIEAAFQLAHIRLNQGNVRQAIQLFWEILDRDPTLTRVRLDLARAYFLDKNYEDATFQFELVKGGDLPPEVQANVDLFLDAIRHQKTWTIDFALSPVLDSNINQVSGGREECIDTAFGTLCRPLDEQASGAGINGAVTVNHFWRFHQDWGLRSTGSAYAVAYEEEEYNDYILYAAMGPRYLWDNGEASLQPTFFKRWIGEQSYQDQYGLRFETRQNFNRLILSASAGIAFPKYSDSYVHSVLKGEVWDASIQARYILTDRTFIQAGLGFEQENTKVNAYGNNNWRYSLGVYQILPYGFSLFAEGSLTATRYHASRWFITKDNRIDEAVRKDKTWQFSTTLSSNVFDKWNLTPMLGFTYTERESNMWTNEYDRSRITFLLNYRF